MIKLENNNLIMDYKNSGALKIRLKPQDSSTFFRNSDGEIDLVDNKLYFDVSDKDGNRVIHRLLEVTQDDFDKWNAIIYFLPADSVLLVPGDYRWDLTYYKNPYEVDGEIVNATIIDTMISSRPLYVRDAVGTHKYDDSDIVYDSEEDNDEENLEGVE